MEEIIKNIVVFILAPAVTLLLGWVLGNRKSVAEVRNLELDATTKAIAIWKDLAQAIENELKEVNTERSKEVGELKKEIEKLRVIVTELKAENSELRKHISTVTRN